MQIKSKNRATNRNRTTRAGAPSRSEAGKTAAETSGGQEKVENHGHPRLKKASRAARTATGEVALREQEEKILAEIYRTLDALERPSDSLTAISSTGKPPVDDAADGSARIDARPAAPASTADITTTTTTTTTVRAPAAPFADTTATTTT